MTDTFLSNFQDAVERNPRYRFWFWQIGFWFFMCVVGFFTLILWYSEVTLDYITHIFMQAFLGLACSLIMHKVFNLSTHFSITVRILTGLAVVLGVAFCWTVMHMQIFVFLTGFSAVWDEFGGWYFSGIFVFLCWTGLFHGVRYYELLQSEHRTMLQAEATSREEHVKRLRAQSEARDAKLKMLRYQLNPHFLCNTLNAINSLIEIGEPSKAQSMSIQLSEFLRYSLDNDPDTKITLEEEIKALSLYLEIERTRFGDRLNIEIDIKEGAQNALVPSLLLQPIIENSMKHAIARSENGGTIGIEANIEGSCLIMSLSDTGDGIERHVSLPTPSEKGVGLKNINQRLNALYEEDYKIILQRLETGGLSTTVSIPLELKNNNTLS